MDAKALAAEAGRKKVFMHIRTILTGPTCSICERHTLLALCDACLHGGTDGPHVQADQKCVNYMHPLHYYCSN